MSRDALIVGINRYDCEQLSHLKAPAEDAEGIAQRLTKSGDFRVRRLPEVINKETSEMRVGRKTTVTLTQLEDALVQLFKPTGDHIPDTALFYFSGHGLRKDRGIQEGFLATSDVNPTLNNWGLRLKWLRELMQESPVRQQIIWLDCCYSGELLNFKDNLEEADPGNLERRDRCFIAASREYEVAYEETAGNHGVLTNALLQALDPTQRSDGLVTNFTLTEAVRQALRITPQRPLFANFGSKITLTGRQADAPIQPLSPNCPYRGLAYFDCNDDDAKYFHGRMALTDTLLEKVRDGNFLAVLGASGSGKSSVVRAGLLHQLQLGQRLSGSNHWIIHILRPGSKPLQSLAEVFLEPGLSAILRADQLQKAQTLIQSGAIGLVQLITAIEVNRVVLVVDQFEECFTLCHDITERQAFFECLLGAVEQLDNKLCLVLTMRADFFGKCLEQSYAGLAQKIEANLVTVVPMQRQELEQAITEPAKQAGLEIEGELIAQMLLDVESSPGSLPLLQYTLTELWKRRTVNWLSLTIYNQLGGVRGTLERRAEEVYASLSDEEQGVAKQIFLELTQLGDGTEDTRRQVLKRELVTTTQLQNTVDRLIQRLAAERLVVTSELVERSATSGRIEVIDIAHEALIRHWPRLRKWIADNRIVLQQKRAIEDAAEEWWNKGKSDEPAYLLQGPKLAEAESFFSQNAATVPLSSLAAEFVRVSQADRDRRRHQERVRKRWQIGTAITVPVTIATAMLLFALQQQRSQKTLEAVFLDTDTAEILGALPSVLWQARDYQKQADQLGAGGSLEQAITYYRDHKSSIDQAFAYYRQILRVTGRLNQQIKANTNTSNDAKTQIISRQIEPLKQEAETALGDMIIKYRIPELKRALETVRPSFGRLLANTTKTDFENQYTDGALRITYTMLMRESGAGADLNNDGFIRDQQEADQLPCKILKEVERLWRSSTQQRCGWYGPHDAYQNSHCRELDVSANTLTIAIFDFDSVPYLEARLKSCGISAPNPSNPGVKQ